MDLLYRVCHATLRHRSLARGENRSRERAHPRYGHQARGRMLGPQRRLRRWRLRRTERAARRQGCAEGDALPSPGKLRAICRPDPRRVRNRPSVQEHPLLPPRSPGSRDARGEPAESRKRRRRAVPGRACRRLPSQHHLRPRAQMPTMREEQALGLNWLHVSSSVQPTSIVVVQPDHQEQHPGDPHDQQRGEHHAPANVRQTPHADGDASPNVTSSCPVCPTAPCTSQCDVIPAPELMPGLPS